MNEQAKSPFLGDLGEMMLTWHLRSKYRMNVAIVKGKGIDLLCTDKEGRLFPKNQNIGISVKTRARKKVRVSDQVNIDWEVTKNVCNTWGAIPYIAYVRIAPELGTLTFFLTKVADAEQWGKGFNVSKAEKTMPLFQMSFDPYEVYSDW